jgi:hypothetical protein
MVGIKPGACSRGGIESQFAVRPSSTSREHLVLVYVSRYLLLLIDSQGTVQHVAQIDSALLVARFLTAL